MFYYPKAQLALFLALVAFPPSILGSPIRGVKRELQQDDNNTTDGEDVAVTDGPSGSILDIATSNQALGTLVTALSAAGLVESLGGPGPYTVFAPTNQAFVEADIEFLLDPEWILHLQSVLQYHVVEGEYTTATLQAGEELLSVFESEILNITSVDPFLVNDVEVIDADLMATNGVVHVVNEVLFPEFTEVSVVELAAGVPDQFSTLVELLIAANLTGTLEDDAEAFTVFAPNNDAFAKLDPATLEMLTSPDGADLLEEILLYHVVPGVAYAQGVEVDDTAITLNGGNITVTAIEPNLVINNVATVISADILTRNGVIHVIDTVLMPPTSDETTDTVEEVTSIPNEAPPDVVGELDLNSWVFLGEDYSTLYSVLNSSGLVEAMSGPGPLTLFAPNNAAFASVPEKYLQPEWYAHLYDILLYHVVPGAQQTLNLTAGFDFLTGVGENITITGENPWVINNNSMIIDPDNVLSNGVAHGINQVLLPPSAIYTAMDIIEASPFFRELNDLIAASGLAEALSGPGPFTIFAPTNNAIGMLDADTSAVLRSPEGLPQLQAALQYHVVPGIILSEDVVPGQTFETLQGCLLTLSQEGRDFFINNEDILDADILASNGVIHVISGVLMPDENCVTAAPEPEMEVQMTTAPTDATEAPMEEPVPNVTEPPMVPEVAESAVDVVTDILTNTTGTNETEPETAAPEEEEEQIRDVPVDVDSSAPMPGLFSAVAAVAMLPLLLV